MHKPVNEFYNLVFVRISRVRWKQVANTSSEINKILNFTVSQDIERKQQIHSRNSKMILKEARKKTALSQSGRTAAERSKQWPNIYVRLEFSPFDAQLTQEMTNQEVNVKEQCSCEVPGSRLDRQNQLHKNDSP